MSERSRVPASAPQLKEVTLRLPLGTLVELHNLKLLTNKSIQRITTEALRQYFREHPVPDPPAAGPSQ